MSTSKDFTCTRALFNLFRNLTNYRDSLHRKSYLTLHSVTSPRDPFCLWTFAYVFARKQRILCSALHHKSYLTLPRVTSFRDSFRLGTLAHGFIMLPLREAARWQWAGSTLLKMIIYIILQIFTTTVNSLLITEISIRQTSRKSWHLGMVLSFLQCCTLTFCKANISLRRTLMSVQWCRSWRDWLIVLIQGHPTAIFGKYLFGRRSET